MANNRPHWADTAIAVFTGLMLVTYITGNYFSCQQLKLTKRTFEEVQKGSTDTHDLAIAAKDQAAAAKLQVEQMKRQAEEAANSVAQSRRSLDATIEQFRLDQRPWVTISGVTLNPFVAGQPISITVAITNTGKTLAFDSIGQNLIVFPTHPLTEFPDPTTKVASLSVLTPNIPYKSFFNGVEPLTQPQIDAINNGQLLIYMYGFFTYRDGFNGHHKTIYCFHYLPDVKALGVCDIHNSAY